METPSSASSSSIITPEDVLESLMNDGTIDTLRLKIINQLKSNEELKNTTLKMAEQSKVLNTPGAEKQTKRELFDALRQELETPVLEKASRSVWELILDGNGLGREINETVERVYCRLNGREPPLFPQPDADAQPKKETGKKEADERRTQTGAKKEKSDSNTRKRSFGEMTVEGGENEVLGKPDGPPTLSEHTTLALASLDKFLLFRRIIIGRT